MKTELELLVYMTQNEAQKLLDVNDPGHTVIVEGSEAKIFNREGVVIAEVNASGVSKKVLL